MWNVGTCFEKRPIRKPYICEKKRQIKSTRSPASAEEQHSEIRCEKRPMKEPYQCEKKPMKKDVSQRPSLVERRGKSTRTLARAQKSGIQRLQFEKRPTKEP